jgi:hypothetical protein
MRALATLAVAAMLICLGVLPGQAERRVALVIGNSNYQHAGRLGNPAGDAAAFATLLKASGFDVVERRNDVALSEMNRVIGDFADVASNADIAIVYYAGHGIEVDGVNYLIPIDARLARDFDVEAETVSLDRLLRAIETARRLRLVILDSCRENPFAQSMRRSSRAIGRGLARVEPATPDTLVAFAAKAGSTASDGDAANSPFTAALLRHITTPGLDIRLALGRVRDEVMETTRPRQEPFVYGSLGGRTVSIVDPPAAGVQGTPTAIPQRPQPQPPPPPATAYYFVGPVLPPDPWLALRSEPSDRAGVRLMKMPEGTLLRLLETRDKWYKVELRDGSVGWAHSGWIRCCKYLN